MNWWRRAQKLWNNRTIIVVSRSTFLHLLVLGKRRFPLLNREKDSQTVLLCACVLSTRCKKTSFVCLCDQMHPECTCSWRNSPDSVHKRIREVFFQKILIPTCYLQYQSLFRDVFLLQEGRLHTNMLKYTYRFSPPAAHVCFDCLHTDTLLQQRHRRWMWWSWHVRNSVLSDLPPQPQCGPGPGRANWLGLKKTCQIDRELRWVMFFTRSLRCPIKGECTKQELCQTFITACTFAHAAMMD